MMTTAMTDLFTAREAQRSGAAPTGDRPRPTSPGRSQRVPVQPLRRVVVGVLVGALTMFGVATLDSLTGATVPVLGSFAALPDPAPRETRKIAEVPPPPATPGTCLNWTRADAADSRVVDCTQPHLFEQAGSVQLTDQAELPDDRRWRQLVHDRCTPLVLAYLGGKFDPNGRFRIGALRPSPGKWASGDRELRCGLQSASRSGALYPMTGKVADQDQAAVHDPGTCLGIDGRTVGDPVDCADPHAVETVGIVDLSKKFPDKFPAVDGQDSFLQPECTRIATEYAGSADVISKKGLTVYWDNLTEDSWAAGTRRVNCNLAALLPDRSGFAPVTGSVKGDVSIGASAAPPAADNPQPGAPAPDNPQPANPRPTSPPSSGAPVPAPAEPPPPAPSSVPVLPVPSSVPDPVPTNPLHLPTPEIQLPLRGA